MKTNNKSPLIAAMGVAIMSSFSATANAEANPFGMTELSSGYMQVAEAKAPEMKCGASMNMGGAAKTAEGACAGAKTPAKTAAKATEGKCGDMMDGDKMKKGMESACGAMMKGKEGACGEMMKGESMKGKEGACGAGMKMPEGKCGAQCGEAMKNCAAVKAKEGNCGAQMKGCGEAMQGCSEMMKGKEGACAATVKPAAPAAAVPAPAKK
ncbi:hypothetical protein [Methylovulum miyakonense]|uniref:hypothetical protein n=1 Tax=Methylovulum miyakonense TaxID=645578 RepID=UPI00036FABFB|nr:hypothetical protein [Methylovulum miyakonense]